MRTTRTVLAVLMILAAGGLSALDAQGTAAQTIKLKVVAEQANLRERPDIGSAILQMIPQGTILDADRKEGEWYLARYTLEDGGVMAGYIHESLVAVVKPSGGQPAAGVQPLPKTQVPAAQGVPPQPRPARRRVDPDFRISVSTGWSRIRPEDLDAGGRGFADFLASDTGIYPEGSLAALRSALHLGIDFSVQIAPQIYFSLGTEIFRGTNSSSLVFPLESGPVTYTTKPTVQAIPIKAGLTYYPLRRLYLKAVFGYYFVTAEYFYDFPAESLPMEWKAKTTSQGLGVEGAAGYEWSLSPKTILFAEAGYRYAKIGRFVGTETFTSDFGFSSTTTTGTLYHFLQEGGDLVAYPLVFVRETLPEGAGISGAREAKIDLSGVAVRAGVRFRF